MKFNIQLLPFIIALCLCTVLTAQVQDPISIAQSYVATQQTQWQITEEDIRELKVSDSYVSQHNKVSHVYFLQRYKGIEVHNGVININILPNGKVFFAGFNGIPNLPSKVNTTKPTLTAQDALTKVAAHLGYSAPERWVQIADNGDNKFTFDKSTFAYEDIKAALCFQRIGENKAARLAWSIEVEPIGGQDLWSIRVDAENGRILEQNSKTAHCTFHDHKALRVLEYYTDCIPADGIDAVHQSEKTNFIAAPNGSYNVFKFPVESPIHGNRSITYDSLYTPASPYGWHDVNGVEGAEYTITRGNNVHAYDDIAGANKSQGNEPDGGTNLVFDFPYSPTAEPEANIKAAVTNLFYVNNFMHDVSYRYGFDEVAGNFQQKNYTNKGYANDAVQAEAIDGGGTNNANFATPSDGGKPRMQMYRWNSAGKAFNVNSPSSIAGSYDAGTADFGQQLSTTPVTGDLVLAYDGSTQGNFGCNAIKNASEVKGKIAVLDRGGCFFVNKALNAQKAGAIALVIVDFEEGTSGMTGTNAGAVTIPIVKISKSVGDSIKKYIKLGTINVSLVLPATSIPLEIDGDFDNGIIAHEYGHGISNRLTGGPSLSDCLNNQEQMGEGWSDIMTLITTTKPGDKATNARGVGNFANRTSVTDIGIRSYPYSSDMRINPDTYSASTGAETHRLGSVWTAMAWDLYWKMAEVEGFDPDLLHGKGGNNKAIQLIMDGMKLQKCQPGFEDGRDAILAADEANYEGAHKCLIWEVFARRGLGADADQGSSLNSADTKEGYKSIPECQKTLKLEKIANDIAKIGDEITITLNARNDTGEDAKNTIVTDFIPNGLEYISGSASDGGAYSNNMIAYNLGTFAKGAKKTLTYKVKVKGNPSKTIYFEGFNGRKSYDDNWLSEQDIPTGAAFDATQDKAYEGTWSLEAHLEDAFESNATTNLAPGKGILVTGQQPVLRFYQDYKIQHGFDGVILQFSKDDGNSWVDAGNLIFKNGYNGPIAYSTYSIPNTKGFWGDSKGWIPTYVDLKDYVGEKLIFRFRYVADKTLSEEKFEKGIAIDNIEIMDMVNYHTEACISADNNAKNCALMESKGIKIESDRGTSVKDIASDLVVTLFPNPANEQINLNVQSGETSQATIAIVDMAGKVVYTQQSWIGQDSQMLSVNTAALPKGIYTVKVTQKQGFIVKKFVKM